MLDRLGTRCYAASIRSPPCNTFFQVDSYNGPRLLRSASHPLGFPWLEGAALARAQQANILAQRTYERTRASFLAGTPYITEFPEDLGTTRKGDAPASQWQLQAIRQLAADTSAVRC